MTTGGLEAMRGKDGRPARFPPTGTRRPEMDDWLNTRIYHPLSVRIAYGLASTPVTPNMISLAGGAMIVLAGFLYVGISWPLSAALGFLAHAAWHVLDGADGDLARLTGRASPVGELVDGLCDYIGHALLYVFLGWHLAPWLGMWAWIIGWVSGLCRAVQANHAESLRRTYLWRGYGVPWLKQSVDGGKSAPAPGRFARIMAPVVRAYVALASAGSPLSPRIDSLIARASRTPEGAERARRICREASRVPLRLQTVLGANWRTVALALSMAAGSPLWFFLLEIVGFNLLLLASLLTQRAADRRIVERLEANAALLGE